MMHRNLPHPNHYDAAMRTLEAVYKRANQLCKSWKGPGTTPLLLEAMGETKIALNYSTLLLASYKRKHTHLEITKTLESVQATLFNQYAALLDVAKRRSL